jgi:hypothetical protein
LSPAQQADTKTIYNANRAYKDTETNIRRTANAALSRVVPDAYNITSTMEMIGEGRNYFANNGPQATLGTLRVWYSKATLNEMRDNEKNWNVLCWTSLPIEGLFFCL